jgi:hypothetical protein
MVGINSRLDTLQAAISGCEIEIPRRIQFKKKKKRDLLS